VYDKSPTVQEAMLKLLESLSRSSEISSLQVYKGFQRFVDQLYDLALDTPHLQESFHTFYDACIARGIVDPADKSTLDASEWSQQGESDAAAHVRSVGEFTQDSTKTIQEYFDSSDIKEVSQRMSVRCSVLFSPRMRMLLC
jgi:hypothetical protein